MSVSKKDRAPARIHGLGTAPTPTGLAEIVSDDFPVLHAPEASNNSLAPEAVALTRR